MWKLSNNTLTSPEGVVVFREVPAGVSLEADPMGAGVFLKVAGPAEGGARWVGVIGKPTGRRFAACYRREPFWMQPRVVADAGEVPVETQVLFAAVGEKRAAVIVPLYAGDTRCALEGVGAGTLGVVAETGNRGMAAGAGLVFVAVEGEEGLSAFVGKAAAAVGRRLGVPLRKEKSLPGFVEVFGWCTWDAFYTEVSAAALREGLESFRAGVAPRFLILDDGWQSEENQGEEKGRHLTALVPNEKFEGTLAPTIRMAKEEFGVEHFLVWHAYEGYWGGVDPEKLARYGPVETGRDFSEGILHHYPHGNTKWWGSVAGVVPPTHIEAFFDDYHRGLKEQGVDGVKVDNQATLEALTAHTGMSRVGLYGAYREALEKSTRRHFGGVLLNCMSCANDILYGIRDSSLVRTSVDFWPARPETHGYHVWINALVGLWFGEFVHPDWDMFQSALPEPHRKWSEFHAAARGISGSPLYVSDKPGVHDFELIRKLVCGDGRVLRSPGPAVIARESLFHDVTTEGVLLKVINTVPVEGATVRGIVGLFNCHYQAEEEAGVIADGFGPGDVPALAGAERYVVYLHKQGRAVVMRGGEKMVVTLGQAGYEIATVVPVEEEGGGTGRVAVVGLVDKFNSAAGVSRIVRRGAEVAIQVRDGGRLGVWSTRRPVRVMQGGKGVAYAFDEGWMTAEVEAGEVVVAVE